MEQAWHLTGLDYTDDVTLLESGSERGQQALYVLQQAEQLRTRIGRASEAFGQLFKIWRSKISLKTKLCIYNAVVISTLLYGSETWVTTNSKEKRLDVFDNWCLCRILGIKWFHHVRNTTVIERTGQTPAFLFLKTRRSRWFGNFSWMGQERLPKALSQWRPENAKRSSKRRCCTQWRDAMELNAGLAGIDQDLDSMASDKAQWRDMLALLVS